MRAGRCLSTQNVSLYGSLLECNTVNLRAAESRSFVPYNRLASDTIAFPSDIHCKAGEMPDSKAEIRHVEHIV